MIVIDIYLESDHFKSLGYELMTSQASPFRTEKRSDLN
jgi:hypothetical protein